MMISQPRINDRNTSRRLRPVGRVLLAPFPDPRRPEAAAVYARHFDVFARGVVPAAGREPACILFAVGGHTWSLPVVICGAGATEASVSADIRTLEKQRHRDAAVIVQAGADGALEALEAALDRQSGAAQEPAIRPFDPEWITSVGEPTTATPAATETGACRLACVRTSDAVNDLRAESSDRPELVLRRIAEERATATYEAPCDGNPPPGRVIHASMMGTATLQMDGCEVQFSRGRLSRFAGVPRERRAQLLADTVSGSVRTADGTLELSPETAFSFEESGAGVRGLMSILSLGRDEFHAPGRLLVDYSAVGDFPWLFVDLCFEFPVLSDGATVEELVPFVLPLRMPDRTEDLILTTQYPDGSGSRIDLHGVTGAGCAFGSLLQVGSRFTISWAEPRPGVTGAFRFEVRRGLTGASMAIYPFGRFGAEDAAERAGTATRVRFAIAAGQRDYAEIVDAPPEALRRHQQSSGTR